MTDQRDLAKEVERIVATAEQYGDNTIYSLSDIKMLLLQIASQSRELEELRKLNIQLGTARQPVGHPEWVDAVRNRALHYPDGAMLDDIYALLGQVDELRRPVALGDELEAIRKEWKQDIASLQEAIRAGYVEQGDITDAAVAVNTLLSALDQAQREIARLSSPPEERGEIVERQRLGWPQPLPCHAQAAADIDTLIQDNIRYRNAHAILLAERDEARGKVERIGKLCESLTAESVRLIKDKASQANRIEQLEGALQVAFNHLDTEALAISHMRDLATLIVALPPDPDRQVMLAAADGQQQRRDELNAKFRGRPRLRGPEDDFKAPAEDQPSATGDGVEGE